MTELGEEKKKCIFLVFEYLVNIETYFSHLLSMFEAKVRNYFQGAFHHYLVPDTEVPETVQLALNSLQYLGCLKLGVNIKFLRVFEQ